MSVRTRLTVNLVLWLAIIGMGSVTVADLLRAEEDVAADDASARVGESVGGGTVTALAVADAEGQARVAEVLRAAERMADAFVNLRFDNAETAVATVRELATGAFQRQYDKWADDVVRHATKAHSVMAGKVLWTALVAGDEDSATVIAATTGTVDNKSTRSAQQRNYRLQLELALVDGEWLTRDLQFVG